MANLFHKQAGDYAEARPSYPEELFQFIASKTPNHDLVWDVGTGSGQAANALAGIYKNVVATDTSQKQLDFAPKLPNIQYKCTPPTMTMDELERVVAPQSSLDLVTIAQALHWFDLPTFYHQVKWLLKKPHGVIAAWCYTIPEVNNCVDAVFRPFYVDSNPYWDPVRELVDNKYRGIGFPFERVDDEVDHTGPLEFKTKRVMDLEGFFGYIRSWSAYQTARPFYVDSNPYWDPVRELVDNKYRGIGFPFERVDDEVDHTGPLEFKTKRVMDLEGFFGYIRSWSAYQTAKEKGVELLRDDVVESFKRAWSQDGEDRKVVVFPVHLRIGKVGNFN